MSNRLANETSPYLLQHAENPVDWYPWGPEAIERAKSEDKPIFLSIGYSACHWCHVMAHESFENAEIARFLNEHFVSIKVDREEHPELDMIYMEAVQMLMGHGGWPLSAFLTPDLQPFFGGTYWPPRPRGQMPGFDQVLHAIQDAWQNRRPEALEQAGRLTELLRESVLTDTRQRSTEKLGSYFLDAAYATLSRTFDPHYGGFGGAPKFPHAMALQLLLRRWRRDNQEPLMNMVRLTLDRMAMGGMYDQLGGGFHRYSTDDQWLVPHFEKMLYDNALLAACYVEAWQATGDRRYARIVRETLDYVLRDMTDPEGGYFYSSEDADSEGHEGKFYLWSLDEVRAILGRERAETFAYVYDVTDVGNFEGRNILNTPKSPEQAARILRRPVDGLEAELAEDRCKLFGVRSKRSPPGKDDKLLVSWNGLMIESLARAGAALDEPRYTDAAARATEFLLANLIREGRLYHTWRQGRASIEAFLEDYASLANALITMYEARFQESWIDQAVSLADQILDRFVDREGGGFYMTAKDRETVLVRKKEVLDTSTPSGGALAATALVRLGKLCGRRDYLDAADAAFRNAVPLLEQAPLGTAQMLLAMDMYLGPTPEVVILGFRDDQATTEVLGELHHRFIPNKIVAFRDMATLNGNRSGSLAAIFEGKRPVIPGPTVYICKNFSCQAPVTGKDAALAAVSTLAETAPV